DRRRVETFDQVHCTLAGVALVLLTQRLSNLSRKVLAEFGQFLFAEPQIVNVFVHENRPLLVDRLGNRSAFGLVSDPSHSIRDSLAVERRAIGCSANTFGVGGT